MNESNLPIRPIIAITVSPKFEQDSPRFDLALEDLAQESPTIAIRTDPANGQSTISGMSEAQLEAICLRLRQHDKIEIDVSEPAVVYLETIRRQAEAEGKYVRQVGGMGNYSHCKLRVEPNEPGSGYEFIDRIMIGRLSGEYIASIDRGVRSSLELGILSGHRVVDIRVTLIDGSHHDKDSNDTAFRFAAAMAFERAARNALPVVLEPVMAAELAVPEQFTGQVLADINVRRGHVNGIETQAGLKRILATIPLAETLASSPRGRALYTMQPAGYEPVAPHGDRGEDPGATVNKPGKPPRGSGHAATSLDFE